VVGIGLTKVERVVLNALPNGIAAMPPDICAFGDCCPIVFEEVDPPLAICPDPRSIRDIRGTRGSSKKSKFSHNLLPNFMQYVTE